MFWPRKKQRGAEASSSQGENRNRTLARRPTIPPPAAPLPDLGHPTYYYPELFTPPRVSHRNESRLFPTRWRTLDWDKRSSMKDSLRGLQLSNPDAGKLRILVHGPVGAGKSSFINSIDSIFQERMTSITTVDSAAGHSFTKKFQTHYIKDQRYGSFVPFAICDVMGLEIGHSEGVNTRDLEKILQGHIKDGYAFNPANPCSENDHCYNSSPKRSDRIHCLVSVIPADRISLMDDAVINKMRDVRATAGSLKIPQLAVLTKVDETCPEVCKDIKLVYMSKKIKEKMQVCSNRLGVPMNCIFPVKCYHEEIQLNNDVDVLLLSALTFILNFANDHVADMAPPTSQQEQRHLYPQLPH